MIDVRRKPSTYGYGDVLITKQVRKEDEITKREYHQFQNKTIKRSFKRNRVY